MWSNIVIQTLLLGTVQAVPYSEYILAPSSRTVFPVSVYRTTGTVDNAEALTDGVANGSLVLSGSSSVTLDFGKNIAGQVSLTTGTSSNTSATLALTYTESSVYVSNIGCDSTANTGIDRPLVIPVGQTYTVERKHARGGFRYLSVINNGTVEVELSELSVSFTAAPTQDLQDYTGYFNSNDELLNRVWYAGAYTNRMCFQSILPAGDLSCRMNSGQGCINHCPLGQRLWDKGTTRRVGHHLYEKYADTRQSCVLSIPSLAMHWSALIRTRRCKIGRCLRSCISVHYIIMVFEN